MSKDKKNKNEYVAVGGQALMEGIMMKGPTKIVAVVRKPNGELTEKDFSEGTSRFSKVKKTLHL